jgi:hypothetical protein
VFEVPGLETRHGIVQGGFRVGRAKLSKQFDISTFSLKAESVVVVGKYDRAVLLQGPVLPGFNMLGHHDSLCRIYLPNFFRCERVSGGEPEVDVSLNARVV